MLIRHVYFPAQEIRIRFERVGGRVLAVVKSSAAHAAGEVIPSAALRHYEPSVASESERRCFRAAQVGGDADARDLVRSP